MPIRDNQDYVRIRLWGADIRFRFAIFIQKINDVMIEVKDAASAAVNYLQQLLPHANNVQLEEVEISEDERFWNVTLSYEDYDHSIPSAVFFNRKRKYKIFRINADSGSVLSMKIRELS